MLNNRLIRALDLLDAEEDETAGINEEDLFRCACGAVNDDEDGKTCMECLPEE